MARTRATPTMNCSLLGLSRISYTSQRKHTSALPCARTTAMLLMAEHARLALQSCTPWRAPTPRDPHSIAHSPGDHLRIIHRTRYGILLRPTALHAHARSLFLQARIRLRAENIYQNSPHPFHRRVLSRLLGPTVGFADFMWLRGLYQDPWVLGAIRNKWFRCVCEGPVSLRCSSLLGG